MARLHTQVRTVFSRTERRVLKKRKSLFLKGDKRRKTKKVETVRNKFFRDQHYKLKLFTWKSASLCTGLNVLQTNLSCKMMLNYLGSCHSSKCVTYSLSTLKQEKCYLKLCCYLWLHRSMSCRKKCFAVLFPSDYETKEGV